MTKSALLFFFLLSCFFTSAANKYWVSFKDKANVTFNPQDYFDQRTIQQRIFMHIPVYDSLDFPVNDAYIKQVSGLVDSVSWCSRWLNGIAVYASSAVMMTVCKLQFVAGVKELNNSPAIASLRNKTVLKKLNKNNIALLKYQTERLQGKKFAQAGLNGTGIRIAVFDVGFPQVNKSPVFSHLFTGNKIIATYDFLRKSENVYKGHWHGTATLSCIAGKADSLNIGLATGAEFLLARTESVFSENISEEENWLAAAEWADKHGVNIISCSLGYTTSRYFNYEMDGHTSLIARAATIAASKGILVVNAAGNEGTNSWTFLVTPGDVDSVLTVGGTDPLTDFHIPFSSYGPSAVGKIKPNICASGRVVAALPNKLTIVEGTSFAAPMVAGFAACAWQSHRSFTNMELFEAIEKSAHLYPYYDYANGFGIPQAGYFLSEAKDTEPTFDFVIINNDIKVFLRNKFSVPEAEFALGYNARRNFYYKIENRNGFIEKYFVLLAENKEMLHLFSDDFQPGEKLTVHFEGYTQTIEPAGFK